jgi:hypothetical protein
MPNHWYDDYERGRPGYPPEVVNIPGVPSSATVLDLGAGTGKLTRLLVSTFVRVVAVEPDEQLLQPHWPKGWDLPLDLGLSGSGHGSGDWRIAFAQSVFEELHEVMLPNPQTIHPEELVAFFGSMGWIAMLPDEERLPLLENVSSLLTATEYRLPWQTSVYRTRLAQPEVVSG